jgi:uncharacterized membrane protein
MQALWSTWSLVGTLALVIVLNARDILRPYSFWLDELATISLFNHGSGGLWNYVIHDNFPPLYFLLIQAWSAFFGHGEISIRIFSFLCVVGAFITMACFVRLNEPKGWIWPVFSVGLIGTLPTVAYYAQEARPYALLLLLSSLTITSALAVLKHSVPCSQPYTETGFYLSAFLLSLTHYFGLILVVLIVLANSFFLRSVQKLRNLLLLFACLIWPVIHAFHGKLLSQAGGNFWIQVVPVIGTIKVFFVTTPFLVLLLPLSIPYLLPILRECRNPFKDGPFQRSLPYLSLVFLSFVGLMIVLDLHTPLSLPRYYVSIIPVAVLLVVELTQSMFLMVDRVYLKTAVALLACTLLVAQSVKAQHRLALKTVPEQNWKELSEIIRQHSLCKGGCDALGYSTWGEYYFSGLPVRNLDPAASEKWKDFRIQRPLLGFHRAASLVPSLLAANPGVLCLEPRQSIPGSTYLMADRKLLPSHVRRSLVPCAPAGNH